MEADFPRIPTPTPEPQTATKHRIGILIQAEFGASLSITDGPGILSEMLATARMTGAGTSLEGMSTGTGLEN